MKKRKGESVKIVFRSSKELADKCHLGDIEDSIDRDVFIANMLSWGRLGKASQLLRETVEPRNALQRSIIY